MKLYEKLNYLQNNYIKKWLLERQKQEDLLSDACSMFCVCGRLCTGLHEKNCRKFQNKVTNNTVKELKNLLPNLRKGSKYNEK